MADKEVTSKENLFEILGLLNSMNIKYWIDGGWGVDILLGNQNREHRDVDVDFDADYTEELLRVLKSVGYVITTDWRPCRIELQHADLGYIDIHPLVVAEDGSAKQADTSGGWYEFEPSFFTSAVFENRVVPCISVKAQKLFHCGYDLREQDIIDLKNLEMVSAMVQPKPTDTNV